VNKPNLRIRIDNATRTDWLDISREYGDGAVQVSNSTISRESMPPFGEPVTTTILITLGTIATAGFVAWVCKQRNLQRTTLRITVTNANGVVTTIDLADIRYKEDKADSRLVADLVKAGLGEATDGS
jgi:hypothetical protein